MDFLLSSQASRQVYRAFTSGEPEVQGCTPDPHSHPGRPSPVQLFWLCLFPGPTLSPLLHSRLGGSAWPVQGAGSVWPLINSNFIFAWKKEKKESLLILTTQQNMPLFSAEALEILLALVQLWCARAHTHTNGSMASVNAFSLFSRENVKTLQSSRPGLSWGHPASTSGAWLTRRSTKWLTRWVRIRHF